MIVILIATAAAVFCTWVLISYLVWRSEENLSTQLSAQVEGIRQSILAEIETQRAKRLELDQKLCEKLLDFQVQTQNDLRTMNALTQEFKELVAPYQTEDSSGSN